MREAPTGTATVDEPPVDDTIAEAPELSPRELAKQYAENARGYAQQARELTNQLRAAECELDRARADLGDAVADNKGADVEDAIHDRIARAKEHAEGVKAAITKVERRAAAFRSGEKDERLKAAVLDE